MQPFWLRLRLPSSEFRCAQNAANAKLLLPIELSRADRCSVRDRHFAGGRGGVTHLLKMALTDVNSDFRPLHFVVALLNNNEVVLPRGFPTEHAVITLTSGEKKKEKN